LLQENVMSSSNIGDHSLPGDVGSDGWITPWRLGVVAVAVLFPLLLLVAGLAIGYYYFGGGQVWTLLSQRFLIVMGIPLCVITALAVVIILVTATPRDSFTIKVANFQMNGPSVPIILWIGVFLALVFGIYLLDGGEVSDKAAPKPAATASP
jgi:hypothetical protein